MNRQVVLCCCKGGDVESSTDERSSDVAELLSVEPDVRLIVDAVEEKFEAFLREQFLRKVE